MESTIENYNILIYPELDSFLLVEDYIKKYDGELTKKELFNKLKSEISENFFEIIFNYLIYSKKISIDSIKKIGWIYYPLEKKENKDLFWRKK